MRSVPEGQVDRPNTSNVKFLGIGVCALIPIARGKNERKQRPRLARDIADDRGFDHQPANDLSRSVIASHLVNCVRDQLRMVEEVLDHFRVA